MRRLRVLGPLEVDGAATELGPRDRVVVSALALRPGERVDAEEIAEALWGEEPPASAAKVVQGCVSRIRKALGSDAIETVAGGYRVRTDHLDIDRQQFEDLVTRAREHLVTRTPERAITMLTDALALWRGPAFGELEDWMPGQLEAVRLGQLRLSAEEDLLQARLDSGDHQAVAADATVLTGQQPFRERRWALLAIAQYRSGRQADALSSIRAARRALGQELGLDPGSELVALEQRILAQDASLASDHESRLAERTCPWKGLSSYDDRDEETFFGRTADVVACQSKLEESRLLVVTGPSGSGKSSLVQAGLVPALRRSGKQVEVMTPGMDGPLAMAAALNRGPGDPVLVVDQLEEAFTLGNPAFARPWLGDLAGYAVDRSPVVLVVRGDHLAALGADAPLARLVERGLHLVAPLSGDRLREAIEGPAKVSGLRLEPGLVDLMVRDADGQPGALPLLSHALTETWQRRESGLLTVEAYHAVGGIRDAVAASAERLYDGLTDAEQAQLRWLMLHLVSLSESGEPYRTPMSGAAAAGLDPVRLRLLDLLVRGRLVTSHTDGYDVAHEALVRAWPRLRGWLDEDRAGQQIRRHLTIAAAGWDALDRPDSELYRGARLAAVLDWLERGDEPLTPTERAFVQASRAVGDEQVRRLAADARRQRRQNRRLRALVAATTFLLVVAAAAVVVARDQGRAAERQQESATAAAAAARHEALVARSLALRSSNRGAAALLAVEAWREKPDVLAESALRGSLTAAPGFIGYSYLGLGRHGVAAAVASRRRFLAAVGSSVAMVDPSTGEAGRTFSRPIQDENLPSVLRVSTDGTLAVQLMPTPPASVCAPPCSAFVAYDVTTGQWTAGPVRTKYRALDVAVSPDGDLVAVAERGLVGVWNARTGHRIALARLGATAVALGTHGRLYLGSLGATVREVRARRPRSVLRRIVVPRASADRRLLVVAGRVLTVGSRGEGVLDLATGRAAWSSPHPAGHAGLCDPVAVSVPLDGFYCGSTSGLVTDRDLATGRSRRVLDPQLGPVSQLLVTGGGHELVAFGVGQQNFARWRLDGPGAGGRVVVPGAVLSGGYDPTGQWLLVRRHGRTEVVDRSGSTVRSLPRGRATWLSATTVGVVGHRSLMVDVATGRRTSVPLLDVDALYPETTGTDAWAVGRQGRTFRLQRFTVPGGSAEYPVLPTFEADDVKVESNGRVLLVTQRDDSDYYSWVSEEYDVMSGLLVTDGIVFSSQVTVTPEGKVFSVNLDGEVLEFASPYYTEPLRVFAAGRGAAASLQVSADGHLLGTTSLDGTASLYDLRTGTRLGDPIEAGIPVSGVGSWLRPDGGGLVTTMQSGVVEWDLDPEAMASAACRIAGRNPTASEWAASATDPSADRQICPDYPLDRPVPPQET